MGSQLYDKLREITHKLFVKGYASEYIKNIIYIATTIKRKIEMLLNIFCWRCTSINITIRLFWYRLYRNSQVSINLMFPLQSKPLDKPDYIKYEV
jgi:hypothetical protein